MTLSSRVPQTSLSAYRDLDQGKKRRLMRQIVASLLNRGPGTAKELAHRLGVGDYDVERRCSDLKTVGLVVAVGRRVNPSGRSAQVLALGSVEAARAWLQQGGA